MTAGSSNSHRYTAFVRYVKPVMAGLDLAFRAHPLVVSLFLSPGCFLAEPWQVVQLAAEAHALRASLRILARVSLAQWGCQGTSKSSGCVVASERGKRWAASCLTRILGRPTIEAFIAPGPLWADRAGAAASPVVAQ